MTSASDVLTVARRDLGIEENPHGSNRVKFSEWYGLVGPWCAMATSYWLQHAGMPRSDLTHFAYTPYGEAAYRRAGRWGSMPRVGALVFFNFIGRTSHVGIVEAIHADGSITTIEGNTDSAGGRTGGRVMRHRRSSLIVGYGYPEYTDAGDGEGADGMSYFCGKGDKGPTVNLAQRRINRALAPADRIEVDGDFGDATAIAAGKASGQGRAVSKIGAAQIDRIETAIVRREMDARIAKIPKAPAPAPAPATLVPHRHQISSSQTGPAIKL